MGLKHPGTSAFFINLVSLLIAIAGMFTGIWKSLEDFNGTRASKTKDATATISFVDNMLTPIQGSKFLNFQELTGIWKERGVAIPLTFIRPTVAGEASEKEEDIQVRMTLLNAKIDALEVKASQGSFTRTGLLWAILGWLSATFFGTFVKNWSELTYKRLSVYSEIPKEKDGPNGSVQ